AYQNGLRDLFETTDKNTLERIAPGFTNLSEQIGEAAARNQLYQRAWSPLAAAANAAAGAAGGVGFAHVMGGMKPGIMGRGAYGALEGAGVGAGMGIAGEYGRQQAEFNVGSRTEPDFARYERATEEGALPMAAIMTGGHIVSGRQAEVVPTNTPDASQRAAIQAWQKQPIPQMPLRANVGQMPGRRPTTIDGTTLAPSGDEIAAGYSAMARPGAPFSPTPAPRTPGVVEDITGEGITGGYGDMR